MPTSTVPSASARTHSCDLVYLRSAGTLLMVASTFQPISDLPKRTNGGLTTRAARSLPRMSTCTASTPPAGMRASAIERSSVGENVPLVISPSPPRSEEHTSELQSLRHLVCRLLLEKKKKYT